MSDPLAPLRTRRSIPLPMLDAPAPKPEELDAMLTVAARVPDHGKLAPWRFVLYRGEAAGRIGVALADLVERRNGAPLNETQRRVEETRLTRAPLVVAVVSTAAEHFKIPVSEQIHSGAAVATTLEHAVHAMGYGSNWLTEWIAYDDEAKAILGIDASETVIGFVHIGTAAGHPGDRPRPELSTIVTQAEGPATPV